MRSATAVFRWLWLSMATLTMIALHCTRSGAEVGSTSGPADVVGRTRWPEEVIGRMTRPEEVAVRTHRGEGLVS